MLVTGSARLLGKAFCYFIKEMEEFVTTWLWAYKCERPKMALGGKTPKRKLALVA